MSPLITVHSDRLWAQSGREAGKVGLGGQRVSSVMHYGHCHLLTLTLCQTVLSVLPVVLIPCNKLP